MARQTSQIYEITLLGADEQVMTRCHLTYPLPEDFDDTLIDRQDEREVHFQTVQHGAGAAGYEARLMHPSETRKLVRKVQREMFIDSMTAKMAELIGVNKLIELLPAMAELEQAGHQPKTASAHFARS